MMKLKSRIALIIAMIMFCIPTLVTAETAKGKTIRLENYSGSVSVFSGSGNSISVSAKMRVFDGYSVKTGNDSYAYLSLDDTKAIKLDSNTEVKIKKSWFTNKVVVITGKLFFNVTKPLEDNESLDITTPTMSMGIRGTSGATIVIGANSSMQLYTGKAVVKNIRGENSEKYINAGEKAIDVDLEKNVVIEKLNSNGSEIPAMVLKEINSDEELKLKIKEQTNLDVDNFAEQEKTNFEAEEEAFTEKINIIKEFESKVILEKTGNKKTSTENKSVTGRSSGGGTKKVLPALTWEFVTEWALLKTDNRGNELLDFINFASGYSSNLNLSAYWQLSDEAKQQLEIDLFENEEFIDSTYILRYEKLDMLELYFNMLISGDILDVG